MLYGSSASTVLHRRACAVLQAPMSHLPFQEKQYCLGNKTPSGTVYNRLVCRRPHSRGPLFPPQRITVRGAAVYRLPCVRYTAGGFVWRRPSALSGLRCRWRAGRVSGAAGRGRRRLPTRHLLLHSLSIGPPPHCSPGTSRGLASPRGRGSSCCVLRVLRESWIPPSSVSVVFSVYWHQDELIPTRAPIPFAILFRK